jgi:transposase-like protein
VSQQEDPKAKKRLQVIMDHLAGQINATQAAGELGVSRKTFYEWLERARTGMLQALEDRPVGRPSSPDDPEKQLLREEVRALEKENILLEGRLQIQEAIRQVMEQKGPESKKKGPV